MLHAAFFHLDVRMCVWVANFRGVGALGCSGSPKTDIIADVIHWLERSRSLPGGSQALKRGQMKFSGRIKEERMLTVSVLLRVQGSFVFI